MKLRIGYLKERKVLVDVEKWSVQELEDAIRREFSLEKNVNFGVYFGENRVNNVKTDRITELGIVSGDLLIAKLEDKPGENSNDQKKDIKQEVEKMDTSAASSSVIDDKAAEAKLELDNLLNTFHERLLQIGFKKFQDYNVEELCGQTKVIYFNSDSTKIQIRCACNLFGDENRISTVQFNVALINGNSMNHFERMDFDRYSTQLKFDDFIQELKDSIFGPENPLLRALFCDDVNLTLKLFELCGLETVIVLRRTCKVAYKKSNSRYLDAHYWKKQFIQKFGEHQLPTNPEESCRKLLFKKLREQDKVAYLNSIRESARHEMMNYYGPRMPDDDLLHMPQFQRREPDPLSFDPLRNFNDNFYGQEVYRPRNPNPSVPGAPIIYPHIRDDTPGRRQPQNPNNPLQRPYGIGRNDNRFM